MEGYADGTLGPTEKDLVIAHEGLCTRCARELREFAAFIPVMDAQNSAYGARLRLASCAPRCVRLRLDRCAEKRVSAT